MNVCFYTSSSPGISNLLNIGYLINKRPHHNYFFISVAINEKQMSLKERLRKIYGEARFNDGRFDFQRDSLAMDKNLQNYVQQINRSQFSSEEVGEVNDLKSEQFLDKIKPDIIIQAGAGILKEQIFSKATIGAINVHHGISPEIRGIDSTLWCMFYGIKEKTGVTCHFIDERLDTGAVILQHTLKTDARSFIDVQTENYLAGRDVLVNSMDILEKGDFKTVNKGLVRSYYFGSADPFLYYALKKRNFHPMMKITQKAFTMKDANFIVPPASK